MRVLVTGGAGFIGSASVRTFLDRGWEVAVLDDFSRPGSRSNLQWASNLRGPKIFEGSVVDKRVVENSLKDFEPDAILHLAAQVAVTVSVEDPTHDFEVNTSGTLNLLEAVRAVAPAAKFIYSSTNKVYGDLSGMPLEELDTRWQLGGVVREINEEAPLDFHSPYGCSKGAADAYVIDYARVFGLDTTVLRQSCIYGPRQFGIEDQGWVAWFIIAAMIGRKIKVFGDGKQVRDLLHVDDLVALYEKIIASPVGTPSRVYNVGGGIKNSMSVVELLDRIQQELDSPVHWEFLSARTGDQKFFVSDNGRALEELGWRPEVDIDAGLGGLFDWVRSNLELIRKTVAG